MAGLETHHQESNQASNQESKQESNQESNQAWNEVSHAEWSAQDRLRQELRELEEQQRAEQAEVGTEQKRRQIIEERVRRATVSNTELKGETGVRNRKRRKGGVWQQIPYSFDVLCLCAVTVGAAFVIGPLTHPLTPNASGPRVKIPVSPYTGALVAGDMMLMDQFSDRAGNDWRNSEIKIVESTPGVGGMQNIRTRIEFVKGGQPYGAEECAGEWNRATGEVHLQGYNIEQYAYDGAGRLVPGDYTFQLGANGAVQNGVMQGVNGIGSPGTFSGRLR